MAESSLSITEGSGTDLRTTTKSIGGTVHQQTWIAGASDKATYIANATNISIATADSHALQIMGDGTNYVRVHRWRIKQAETAGAATHVEICVFRLSTAGTGGSTVNVRPLDSADTDPYAGDVRTLPTGKGTEGNQIFRRRIGITNAEPLTDLYATEWSASELDVKPFIFGSATTNGIAFKVIGGVASCTVDIEVEFTLTSYI